MTFSAHYSTHILSYLLNAFFKQILSGQSFVVHVVLLKQVLLFIGVTIFFPPPPPICSVQGSIRCLGKHVRVPPPLSVSDSEVSHYHPSISSNVYVAGEKKPNFVLLW